MVGQIPLERQREVARIRAREDRWLHRGVPPGVRVQKIPAPSYTAPPESAPPTDERVLRGARRARPPKKATKKMLQIAAELRAAGESYSAIGAAIGVTHRTVRRWELLGWLAGAGSGAGGASVRVSGQKAASDTEGRLR